MPVPDDLSPWALQVVSAGMDEGDARRTCQLLMTVGGEPLADNEKTAELWVHPPDEPGAEEPMGPFQADPDIEAGALFLSHSWDAPETWHYHFGGEGRGDATAPEGGAQSFGHAKQLQLSTGIRTAAERGLSECAKPARVWMDRMSLPQPVTPDDHPLEKTVFGPFQMNVGEIKSLFPKVHGPNSGYTVLYVPDGHHFEATKQMREFDNRGRPSKDATPGGVTWDMPGGWYHVLTAKVISEDKMSDAAAAEKRQFSTFDEQLRRWCTELGLRDEIWVEMTLGSLRCEYLLLVEPMVALHGGFLAAVSWNYFDRLWPLVEWAIYCARRGPDRVQLCADTLTGPTNVEFYDAIRRISIMNAGCRDPRDRILLLDLIERVFKCGASTTTLGYSIPPPCHTCLCEACKCEARKAGAAARSLKYPAKAVLKVTTSTGERSTNFREISVPTTERVVDFSAVERYVKATVVAVFAHERALVSSRNRSCDDEGGWAELCDELDLSDLCAALKKCKPFDWHKMVKVDMPGEDQAEEAEEAYLACVEAWWTDLVLPVLDRERRLAVRAPGRRPPSRPTRRPPPVKEVGDGEEM